MSKLVRVPLDRIKINEQVRKTFDVEELSRLGMSLKVRQLQPIVIRPDGTLVIGERRVRAGRLVGMTDLLALVVDEDLSDSQIRILQLLENLQRADLSAWEKFQACMELIRLNPTWCGRDLAEHLKLDPSHVTRLLSPSRFIPAALQAFKDGLILPGPGYELSKASPEEQEKLLPALLAGQTRDQLAASRKKAGDKVAGGRKRNGSVAGVKLLRAKLVLPSGISITVAGVELELDQLIEALSEAKQKAEHARESGANIKTIAATFNDQAKASHLESEV